MSPELLRETDWSFGAAGSRSAHRTKVFLQGHWRRLDASYPLHLLDISVTGARAHAATLPIAGSYILLECGVDLGTAQVSWSNGPYFGCRFVVAITPAVVSTIASMRVK